MIHAKLIVEDGRMIRVSIRERDYRALTPDLGRLSWRQRFRVLFAPNRKRREKARKSGRGRR